MYVKIFNHVKCYLSDYQHGFITGRSTTTNLVNFVQYVSSNLDRRVQVDTIYTDFSKAFDKINHKKLLSKLSFSDFQNKC